MVFGVGIKVVPENDKKGFRQFAIDLQVMVKHD